MKYSIILICILSIFLIGSKSNSEELRGLEHQVNSFNTLKTMIEDINKRLSKLEEKFQKEIKQFKDADSESNKVIVKDIMVKVNKRIDKIEKSISIVEIKESLKTFEDKLDLIKNRISGLSKLIEDMEVQATVTEKMYLKAQESVEPTQILTKEAKTAETTTPNARTGQLQITNKDTGGMVNVESKERKEPKELKRFTKLKNIDKGISVSNITIEKYGASSILKGKLRNDSRDDIVSASFILRIYGEDEKLIREIGFNVTNIKSGASKSFNELLSSIIPSQISRCDIKLKKSL